MALLTATFWRSIGWALLRTALAGLVPFLPALLATPAQTWPVAASTVVLLLIVTVATSLRGLPDSGAAAWWEILAARGLRQFGQFVAAGLVGAVVLADVDWPTLLTGAAASALTTVILAALTLIPGDHPTAAVQILPVVSGTITADQIAGGTMRVAPDVESAADEPEADPGDCPHAAPHRYCDGCVADPCPIGLN